MPSAGEWIPRIAIATTEEQLRALQLAIPWGMRDKLFRAFADELIRIEKEHGQIALSLLQSKGLRVILREDEHG